MRAEMSIAAAVPLLAIDRALKLIAQKGLIEGWSFFDFYPRLTFHQNYGIAFAILIPRGITIALTTIILVALIVLAVRAWRHHTVSWAPFLFIVVGASSNLFDRIRFGYVIDMIEFFPRSVWNIADIMIIVGLFLFITRRGGEATPDQSP